MLTYPANCLHPNRPSGVSVLVVSSSCWCFSSVVSNPTRRLISSSLVSFIDSNREDLDPIIEKVVDTELILSGQVGAKWACEWRPVSLMDEVEVSLADKQSAEARSVEIDNQIKLIDSGLQDEYGAIENLLEKEILREKVVKKLGKEKIAEMIREKKSARLIERISRDANS